MFGDLNRLAPNGGNKLSWMPKANFTGDIRSFLPTVPLFKDLAAGDLQAVADAMMVKKIPVNACIFSQGDRGDAFYVLTSGEAFVKVNAANFLKVGSEVKLAKDVKIAKTMYPKGTDCVLDKFDASRGYPYTVRVIRTGDRGRCLPEEVESVGGAKDERVIASLRPGDYFGETALLKGAPRSATIVAGPNGPLTVAMLTKERFDALELAKKLNFPKRKAVWAAQEIMATGEELAARDTSKNQQTADLILSAIDSNKHLHDIVKLSGRERQEMVQKAFRRHVKAGDVVIHEGDLFANEFFVVQSGAFQFSMQQRNGNEHDKISQFGLMGEARPGCSFGELALLHNAPRACTVQATEDSVVWIIDRATFRSILADTFKRKMQEYIRVIDSVETFRPLLSDERRALAETLTDKHYIKGEELMTAGEPNDIFFILLSGTISKSGQSISQAGTYFGEYGLLKKQAAQETIVAQSSDVHVACVALHDFERLLGSLEEILLEHQSGVQRTTRLDRTKHMSGMPPLTVRRSELRKIGLLGCGGFGAVTLEQAPDGQCYAMKQLSKGYVLKMRMQSSVMNEKKILLMCNSPFVVKCYGTYNTEQSLYFLLEPAMGGELYATYHRYRFHGSGSKARFYAASILYAFDHLHERSVLYRDLKPENALIDINGRCKLTDMGLAKQTAVKTFTTCGTPDYFAPEVIQQSGQNAGVDWWCWGVFVHELMSGHAPFEAPNPMKIYQKVVKGTSMVSFPYQANDPQAVEIVKAMLRQNPGDRLAMRAGGSKNVMNHAWYRGFDWNAHANGQTEVPFKPSIKSVTDISNFKAKESDIPPQIPYVDPGTGWDKDFATGKL